MAITKDPKVYLHVQYLRAVAALMVVFQHSQFVHHPNWGGVFGGLGQFGGLGVELFFCISGFVIFATTLRSFSLRNYLLKRCIRIIPIYWLLTCVMAALVLGAPSLFKGTVFTLEHFVRSLLFIPSYTPSRPNEITPLLPPGWTLNFEMFFYLAFGVLLFLLRSRLAVLGALAALFGLLVIYGSVMGSDNAMLLTYTSPRILEFLAGVVAAYLLLCSSLVPPSPRTAWLLMAAGWIIILHVGLNWFPCRAAGCGVPGGLFGGCIGRDRRRPRATCIQVAG
jgi:exopolysaccharide production protein ExoZ